MKLLKILSTCFAAALLLAPAQATFASPSANTPSTQNGSVNQGDLNWLKQNLTHLGIDKPTQAKLIAELNQGKVWDSMIPANQHMAENYFKTLPNNSVKKYTFEDGSVLEESISIPSTSNSNIQPDLSGGTVSCGSGYCAYNGVTVENNTGSVDGKFLANYEIVNGGADQIDNAYQWSITMYLMTYSNVSLTIPIPQESLAGGYAAEADLKWDGSGSMGSQTYYLKLYVGNDTAWQGANY